MTGSLLGDRRRPVSVRAARRAEGGQALVEFALVLPILLLVVTGIIQFGVLLGGQIALVNGVREAARYGSVLETTSSGSVPADAAAVKARLQTVLSAGLPGYSPARLLSSSVCYVSYRNPISGGGSPSWSVRLTVSATYKHALFVPLITPILDPMDGIIDDGVRLNASEEFRVENQPLSTSTITTATCG